MAYDVLVRFTVNTDSEHRARTVVEDLLSARLNPTSTEFQERPHAVLDSWSLWPEERLGVMLMLGSVADGHSPKFIPIDPLRPASAVPPAGPDTHRSCPLRGVFARAYAGGWLDCPIEIAQAHRP